MNKNYSKISSLISVDKGYKSRVKIIAFICAISFFVILFSGCKKLVEIDAPKTEILATTVFSTDGSASAAMTGLYSSILNSQIFLNIGYTCSLYADESDPAYSNYYYANFGTNTLSSSDGVVQSFWSGSYNTIFQANSIIEQLQASKGMSDSVKTRYTAEAKFVRALSHYYLVNLFGAVPIITSTDVKTNSGLGRSDTLTVYKQIITDLADAENTLPEDYRKYNGGRDRPNKYAAAALLAKAYLNIGDYTNAEKQASLVINNTGLYSLLPSSNIGDVFLSNSSESIWAVNPASATGHVITTDMNYYAFGSQYGTQYGPQYVLTTDLVNSFEPGDLRKVQWINSFVYQGTTYYYGSKYKDYAFNAQPTEYEIVLRLSEQYLIRSEARARLNNIPGAQADLNIVRARAGLSSTTATTQRALFDALTQENRVELFLEFGSRWLNLKRTGRANTVLGAFKPSNWKPNSILFPIPLTEIKADPKLTQNPGY